MIRSILFAIAVLILGQKASWSAGQPKLVPGMTRDEVRQQLGEPKNFYSRKTKKHYPAGPEAVAAQQLYGPLLDVYNRKTTNNEYELRVEYSADVPESGLRPAIRVNRAWFIADRGVAARAILADLDEAVDLCRDSGCRLKAKVGPPRSLECLVENPTRAQEKLADRVANGWMTFEGRSDGFRWTPAIILTRAAWTYDHTSPMKTVDWLDEKIEEAELSVTDLLQEAREANEATHRPVIDLGIWNPALFRESERPVDDDTQETSESNQPKLLTENTSLTPTLVESTPEASAVSAVGKSRSHKIVCSDRFAEVPFSSSRPDRRKLACGEEVSVVRESGLWTRVKTKDGMEGNVSTQFVGE